MMTIPPEFFMWVVGGLLVVLGTIGGWVWNRTIIAVVALGKDVRELNDDLAAHKLDSEKNFAKKADMEQRFVKIESQTEDKFGKLEATLLSQQKELQSMTASLSALAAVARLAPPATQVLIPQSITPGP
jgi:hypothetical protein